MFTIYKIVYIPKNKTVYIGRTKQKLSARLSQHYSHINTKMHDLLHKYGKENFQMIPIDYAENQIDANNKEIFWTIFFRKRTELVNINDGNNLNVDYDKLLEHYNKTLRKYQENHHSWLKGKHLPEHLKENLRQKNLGKHLTKKQKNKISNSLKEHYKQHPRPKNIRHLSEETKQKLSKVNRGKIISKEQREKISKALKGIKRRNYSEKEKRQMMMNSPKNKSVLCIETNEQFFSIAEASRITHINAGHISSCCHGKRDTAGGYHWEIINNKKTRE